MTADEQAPDAGSTACLVCGYSIVEPAEGQSVTCPECGTRADPAAHIAVKSFLEPRSTGGKRISFNSITGIVLGLILCRSMIRAMSDGRNPATATYRVNPDRGLLVMGLLLVGPILTFVLVDLYVRAVNPASLLRLHRAIGYRVAFFSIVGAGCGTAIMATLTRSEHGDSPPPYAISVLGWLVGLGFTGWQGFWLASRLRMNQPPRYVFLCGLTGSVTGVALGLVGGRAI